MISRKEGAISTEDTRLVVFCPSLILAGHFTIHGVGNTSIIKCGLVSWERTSVVTDKNNHGIFAHPLPLQFSVQFSQAEDQCSCDDRVNK